MASLWNFLSGSGKSSKDSSSEQKPPVSGERTSTQSSKTSGEEVLGTANGKGVHSGCPVYREELGRCTWTLLHTTAAWTSEKPLKAEQEQLRQFIGALATFYPCQECASEFRDILKTNPPVTRTRTEFAHWLCEVHNAINARLDKPPFDCSRVDERWRDGWKDGSCD